MVLSPLDALSGPLPHVAEFSAFSDIYFKYHLFQEASLIFPNLASQQKEVPTPTFVFSTLVSTLPFLQHI